MQNMRGREGREGRRQNMRGREGREGMMQSMRDDAEHERERGERGGDDHTLLSPLPPFSDATN
jgi:hypothetical protein